MKNILQPTHIPSSLVRINRPAMASSKRKENPSTKLHAGNLSKKPKKEENFAKSSIRPQELETATDSDPLVESDTASQSGDDDGVSWPSDEDAEEDEASDDGTLAEDNEAGGVKSAARASPSARKASNIDGTASGMLGYNRSTRERS